MNSDLALIVASQLGAMLAVLGLVTIVVWVMLIIAHWKMFTKAGEAGWKSLIPIYSDYTLFKITWNTKWFWIYMGAIFVSGILTSMNQPYALQADGNLVLVGEPNMLLDFLRIIVSFGVMIIYVVLAAKTSMAFGKGVAFTFGMVLLPNIFAMILAFGSATYRGPQD